MKMNAPVTKRLKFKLMDEHDWHKLYELDKDPAVMQFLTRGVPTSKEQIKEEGIPRMLAYRNEQTGWGLWSITIKDTNMFIGWILLRPMNFFSDSPNFSDIEIGWRFKQASWGHGYATEAAKALCGELAKQSSVKKISASALADNIGSIKVMEKLGLLFIKTYTHTDEHGELPAVLYSKRLR
ncbi:GNAT family N-acetyltransferase [Pseudoalteromonas sp. 10-33]|uniref:GNAT family N-acetyltransferase n=1 Tax=Pseudoalteromonas sp. 10-33 TaxID=1761890 RepID=UPI0007322760|nr:GNAT family N-acetyltransferase [Pseudoalteromonas sp. 10-33]KTF13851.1 acetyltransferase [Pseudoalteromonas sp. 10-33]